MSMQHLTRQQQKVYDYIASHKGCTTHDITRDTFIQVPSARITEMRAAGVPIISIGTKRYGNETKAFECYAIEGAPEPKHEIVGLWYERSPWTGEVLLDREHEIFA